ncbi:MAG: type III secretion system effector protein [Pseudomonas veronii]|jgi:hypothetical protein|nr:type III secretion system effector protein [Pseudomonas veronii]
MAEAISTRVEVKTASIPTQATTLCTVNAAITWDLPFGFKFIETVPLPENAGRKAIDIEGSPAFKQRVEDDLEFYRGSPNSQHMLNELDAAAERSGAKVTIMQDITDTHIVVPPEGRSPGRMAGPHDHPRWGPWRGHDRIVCDL